MAKRLKRERRLEKSKVGKESTKLFHFCQYAVTYWSFSLYHIMFKYCLCANVLPPGGR